MRQQQNVIELQQFIQTQSFLFYSDTHEYDSNTHQVDQLFVPLFFSSILFFFHGFHCLCGHIVYCMCSWSIYMHIVPQAQTATHNTTKRTKKKKSGLDSCFKNDRVRAHTR